MYRQGVGRGQGTKLLCPSSAWHTPPHACVHQLVLDLCSGVFTELSLQWTSQCPLLRLVKFQPFNHSIFLVSSPFLKLLGAPSYCHPKLLQHKLFCDGRGIMKDKRHFTTVFWKFQGFQQLCTRNSGERPKTYIYYSESAKNFTCFICLFICLFFFSTFLNLLFIQFVYC